VAAWPFLLAARAGAGGAVAAAVSARRARAVTLGWSRLVLWRLEDLGLVRSLLPWRLESEESACGVPGYGPPSTFYDVGCTVCGEATGCVPRERYLGQTAYPCRP
jgi:hypothetical protein